MWGSTNRNPLPPESRAVDLRRHGRLRAELVKCDRLGDVVDLSLSGMRVTMKGRCGIEPGQILATTLRFGELQQPVRAQVKWLKKTGFRSHQMGLEFQEMDDASVEGIRAISRASMQALLPQFHDAHLKPVR